MATDTGSPFSFPALEETPFFAHITPRLWEKEKELEREMIVKGVESLHRNIANAKAGKGEHLTCYGSPLISHGLPALSAAIAKEQEKTASGKAGRLALHVKLLAQLPAEVSAALTLVTIMQSISAHTMMHPLALALGANIEEEINRRRFAEEAPELFNWTTRRAKKSTHQAHKKRLFGATAAKAQVGTLTLTPTDRLHIGVKLIELAVSSLDIIALHKVSLAGAKGKTRAQMSGFSYAIVPTAACLEWIAKRINHCEVLSPKYLPMVVPPKPWDGPFDGGYWSEEVAGRVMIKTSYKATYLEELANRVDDMPEVYTSINAIQAVPWRINSPVLEAARHLWDVYPDAIAGMPPRQALELPPCPVCGASLGDASPMSFREKHSCFDTCAPEILKEWRSRAARAYDLQTSLTSRRMQTAKILYLAQRFSHDTLYFPHQLDFRGRAYPMPAYLTPQGCDLAKGLLTFSEGKALGAEGYKWLAVHTANCFGVDKVSLEARIVWVKEHEAEILAVAADPLTSLWWTEADKPFQFLASCLEWAGWVREGADFLSHLPVAMDGTCNGLQIFSLMLRDEEGGRATNLLPSDKPQDIYAIVAEKVTAKLRELHEHGVVQTKKIEDENGEPVEVPHYDEKEIARKLLVLGITRKTTKRQVMVVPYGGTPISCRGYTLAHIDERMQSDPSLREVFPDRESAWLPGLVLSNLIWEAIGETVVAARQAMSYLQQLAGIASAKALPITWTTPLGFPVLQAYQDSKATQVETRLFGKVFRPRLNLTLPQLSKQRQRQGVSPNYVHSLDAAAMQHTVCIALCEGVRNFRMVHDEYATHAVDAATLARVLRYSFVDLFGGGVSLLDKIGAEVAAQAQADNLPPVPPLGTLQVELVQDSAYFFA